MRVIPGDTMPAIDARLVGGGRWALAQEKPAKLALLAFYRGAFCPICRAWLADLERLERDVFAVQPDLVVWQVGTNAALRAQNAA